MGNGAPHHRGHPREEQRMTFGQRQQKARVLEALERRVKQFRRRDELWPLRIPHEPLPLSGVIDEALGDGARRFDPASLRTRTLLNLTWDDGSAWEAWVIALPSKVKLYCDSSEEGIHLLASGGRNEGEESDRLFLELLAESAGEHFGIEMSGGAPSRVRSSIADREFLLELFVNLFEVSGVEDSVRAGDARSGDFRSDVEQWLSHALAAR
jgi:hypothetical protein